MALETFEDEAVKTDEGERMALKAAVFMHNQGKKRSTHRTLDFELAMVRQKHGRSGEQLLSIRSMGPLFSDPP